VDVLTDHDADEPELVAVEPPDRARIIVLALTVLGALVFGGWWIWPGVSGQGADVDVLVVADGFLADAERAIDVRVRETGRSIEWFRPSGDCAADGSELADVLDRESPGSVVVLAGSCAARALDAGGAPGVVRVVEPGVTEPTSAQDVVDPERLVGRPEPGLELPCMWWEVCPTGTIAVRDGSGDLTPAGADRLAVLVVAGP
jgi:hypothetical protein